MPYFVECLGVLPVKLLGNIASAEEGEMPIMSTVSFRMWSGEVVRISGW